MNFKNLNLINPIIRAVTETGYSQPTEIQSSAIPHILAGKDIMGCSPSGTGKTAAFAMPVLQLLKKRAPEHKEIRTLILTPTRELVTEIEENLKLHSKYLPLSQLSIYEGVSLGGQLAALRKTVDVLVATPGRLLELTSQRHIDLSKIEILILDDTDKMLEIGFGNDVKKVIKLISQKRQTLLFSATMSDNIRSFASTILNNPVEIIVSAKAGVKGKTSSFEENERMDLKNIQKQTGFTLPVSKQGKQTFQYSN
ncbi:DEAD/DEAH box helicase [Chryseobacterium limigenitum]|uniref:ATP-dependent RNA helicase RhlE n=1 Tax=Chryseobacterium limigenitum TaxID=1612149 RepID=A0A1K2IKI9_9FLAO|nr:DEAD/DEAH box helicase [Chryseobacterium limigenitum]SFZ92940.1 ATP-dependent RNA helicase RhlE [Chryseobacterium limigenitum]